MVRRTRVECPLTCSSSRGRIPVTHPSVYEEEVTPAIAGVTSSTLVVKDQQTVSPEGERIAPRIAGVVFHRRPLQEDERGELMEIYNPAWGIHPAPMVYAYMTTIRPGQTKAWILHEKQDDRLFFIRGVIRAGLFDNRPASPTYRMLNVFVVSERSRGLLIIPKGVFHGFKSVGADDALFLNLPTRPYDHADPDKFRLPLKNDLIPFDFADDPGW